MSDDRRGNMIEDVLKKISLSEEQAKSIRAGGDEKASAIRQRADKEAKEKKESGENEARARLNGALEKAKNDAEKHFAFARAAAENDAKMFIADRSGKADEIADELFGRIKNGDC